MSSRDESPRPRTIGSLWIFSLLFAFPSMPLFHRHFGIAGILGYLAFVMVAWWSIRRFFPKVEALAERSFKWWCLAMMAGLAVVFAIGYPMENGRGPRNSSDRDNGLNLAVSRIVEGQSPYYPPSDQAGPLSLLPGAIALGTPFAIAGNSAYQNLFWVAAFLIVIAFFLVGRALSLVLTAGMLGLSPAVQYEFISGGDMLANGLYVPVAMLLGLEVVRRYPGRPWLSVAASLLLGICLASRPNFGLLLPLHAAALWRIGGFPRAAVSTGITGLVALGLCLAFYLPDPAGFTPLPTGNKLALVDGYYPYASKALIVGTLLLAMIAAGVLLRSNREGIVLSLFRWCAAVTLFPMLSAVLLFSWVGGQIDLGFIYDRYGLMYLPFALLGFGIPLLDYHRQGGTRVPGDA